MHFKILKMLATSGFLTALECTKFVFGLATPMSDNATFMAYIRNDIPDFSARLELLVYIVCI